MKENNILTCPVCKDMLAQEERAYKCSKGHAFDLSAGGYLNLLVVNNKKTNNPGDNKIMVNARKEFLEEGYYDFLLEELNEKITGRENINHLDIGCGEGYFTSGFKRLNTDYNIYGMDISKEAIKKASKLNKEVKWIVSSVNNIPVEDNSIDIITQMFAPHNIDEYLRILKDDGLLITVTPGKTHLLELKELLYDNVYLNDEKYIEDSRIHVVEEKNVNMVMNLKENKDIMNLLKMTPYYYKTDSKNIEKVSGIKKIDVQADFKIRVYRRKN